MRPKLEHQLTDQCQQLAKRTLKGAELDLEPFISMGKQPCQAIAKPVSECLIRETSRSGRELGVISELLSGRIGDDAEVVIKRCLPPVVGGTEQPVRLRQRRWHAESIDRNPAEPTSQKAWAQGELQFIHLISFQ